jgi:hypothetical protein
LCSEIFNLSLLIAQIKLNVAVYCERTVEHQIPAKVKRKAERPFCVTFSRLLIVKEVTFPQYPFLQIHFRNYPFRECG